MVNTEVLQRMIGYHYLISDHNHYSAISAKGPWHASAYQMAGYVHISRVTNVTLPDQSNREGIVETADFILFRQILLSIIREFEKDPQSILRCMAKYYTDINEAQKRGGY